VNPSLVSVLAPGVTQVVLVTSVLQEESGLKKSLLAGHQSVLLAESGLRRSR
jgi:hypothetical protein